MTTDFQVIMTPQFQIAFLGIYFTFLLVLIFSVQNVDAIANSEAAQKIAEKIKYNLRDIPRVNYREPQSDEDVSDQSDEEQEDASSVEISEAGCVRRRRDPNPLSRMLDATD
jgi:hypothetical protein